MYSCHFFLISSASLRSITFLSFFVPIFAWNVPLVSLIFLKKLLSFISLHCSCKKAFLSLLAILWNSVFSWAYLSLYPLLFTSLFSAICKASLGNHFAFLYHDFWGWFWSLPPVQCHEPLSIVLQALCLPNLIPWIYLLSSCRITRN